MDWAAWDGRYSPASPARVFSVEPCRLSMTGRTSRSDRRGNASLAAVTATILAGAHLVRVHDVRPSREAAAVADAILAVTPEESRSQYS